MSYIENYDSKSTEKKIRRAAANLSLKKGKDDNYNERIYDEQLERKKEECENYLIEVGIKKIPNFQFALDNLTELILQIVAKGGPLGFTEFGSGL